MKQIEVAKAFNEAALDFSAIAKDSCADIIGRAHMIYQYKDRMSATALQLELEYLRENVMTLNSAFTRLDFAHAAMTVGETASRIRDVVTKSKTTA